MNERIRKLRKALGFSQKEFAEKIGLKQNAISYMEKEGATVTEQNIKVICSQFSVNEEWFRTGVGDPFVSKYELRTDLSDLEKEILNKYNQLDAEDRKAVEGIIDSLYRKTIND